MPVFTIFFHVKVQPKDKDGGNGLCISRTIDGGGYEFNKGMCVA